MAFLVRIFMYCLKNEQFRLSGFKPDNTDCEFLNDFKISDIDQLTLTLIFRFGVIWSKKLDVKFSRVFIGYKERGTQRRFPPKCIETLFRLSRVLLDL